MITRVILLSACLLSFQAASFGQEYVTKDEFDAAIEKLSTQIAALSEKPSPEPSLEDRVSALEYGQNDIRTVQRDQGVVLGQIAMRGDNGEYHWRFDTNSQSARDEFKQAIKSTIPIRGVFVIKNLSSFDKDILVNGYQFRVLGGGTLTLKVAPGRVSTRIAGEPTKYWNLDLSNDYTQKINIRDWYYPIIVRPVEQLVAY